MRPATSSKSFLDWLRRSGIIPENTRRVVIDAKVNDVVMIYIEQYGTTALLDVDPPPEFFTAQVKIVGQEDAKE